MNSNAVAADPKNKQAIKKKKFKKNLFIILAAEALQIKVLLDLQGNLFFQFMPTCGLKSERLVSVLRV